MQKTQMEDYRSAFNGADDMTNKPTEAAAQAAQTAPDVAVVIAEGAPEGRMPGDKEVPMTPQEVQQEKTWAGRLKKREEALKAREAELAAREAQMQGEQQAQGDPELMAKGGKVACKACGGKVTQMAAGGKVVCKACGGSVSKLAEGGMAKDPAGTMAEDSMTASDPAADMTDDMTAMDADMAAADAMPADGQSADPVEQLAADYGPEFVDALNALVERKAREIVEQMGGAYTSEIDKRIANIMEETNNGFGLMQQEILMSVADDIEDVLESDEFEKWVASLPEAEKAKARDVIESGTPSQGVKLLKQYKASKTQAQQGPTPEDVWAEDAAVAVKGKSPVRLPGRPAMSPDDEYRAAFNAA